MIRPELVHPGAAARGLRAVRRPGKSASGWSQLWAACSRQFPGQAKRGPRSERHHGRGESGEEQRRRRLSRLNFDYGGPVPPRLRGREP